MSAIFDRDVYFDVVRVSLFDGVLAQQQVDGQNAILGDWEGSYGACDRRWLAYCLATSFHETASTMWPIEEHGQGAGQPYGVTDPETGQAYYGRGLVQLTWRENYRRATQELGLTGTSDDMEWNAERALDPVVAGHVMFRGMMDGWFREDEAGPQKLSRYFNLYENDAYGAREIINGDKSHVPDWSGGWSIGDLIGGYHADFLEALDVSLRSMSQVVPAGEVVVAITVPAGLKVSVLVNGVPVEDRCCA